SYVVNAANNPETNKYAALVAQNRAVRQRDYVDFLQQNVDLEDPTSLQEAKQVWGQYAREVSMFDPRSKQPLDPTQIMSFDDWVEAKMAGGEDLTAPAAGGGAPGQEQIDAATSELLKNIKSNPANFRQEVEEFDQDFGEPGAARRMIEARLGRSAAAA